MTERVIQEGRAMNGFQDAAWAAETRRLFEALQTEFAMATRDLDALQQRVMLACLAPTDPPVDPPVDPPPAYVPPVLAIVARAKTVKEG
jgi:hypothetical protein